MKTEQVKHTVQTQSYQTFAVDENENVPTFSTTVRTTNIHLVLHVV